VNNFFAALARITALLGGGDRGHSFEGGEVLTNNEPDADIPDVRRKTRNERVQPKPDLRFEAWAGCPGLSKAFRNLDNVNVLTSAAEGSSATDALDTLIYSATQWTVASDLTARRQGYWMGA